jgi:hypothetical protein
MRALHATLAVWVLLGAPTQVGAQPLVPASLIEDARRPPVEFVAALAAAGLPAGLEIRGADDRPPSAPPRAPTGRDRVAIGDVLAAFNAARRDYAADLVSDVIVVRPIAGRLAFLDTPAHIEGSLPVTGVMAAARQVFSAISPRLLGPVVGSGSLAGEDAAIVLETTGRTTILELLNQIVVQAPPRAWAVSTFEYEGAVRVASFGFVEATGGRRHQGIREQWPPDIAVSDPRPLAAVLEELEKRHGWRITYEDPLYLFAADIEDVTDAVSRSSDRSRRVLIPRGGAFTFSYPPRLEPEAVLEALLEAYRWSGHPGPFRLRRAGDVFHVVPVMARNAEGTLEPYRSLLDVRITLPEVERDVLGTIQAMLQEVSSVTGRQVGLGRVPINLFHHTRVMTGANDEPARAVLQQALDATARPLSWRLLCDPGPGSFCMLNVHTVGTAR